MPTYNVNCLPVSLEQNDSTPMSSAMPSLLRVTISLLNRSTSRIWQDAPVHLQRMLLWLQTYDVTIKYQTWQKGGGSRCPLSLCTPQGFRDTSRHHHQPCTHCTWQENWVPNSHPRWPAPLLPCWDNHGRLARWYQWCPTCSMPIPWPQKHPHHWRWPSSFKVKLSSFFHWKGRRSCMQYTKDTWESKSSKTAPGTVCIGLESTQTKSTSLNHAQWYSLVFEMWCGTMSIYKT